MQEMLTVTHLRRTDRDVKGGDMTRLEWVLRNREDSVEIRRKIVKAWCPSDYGLKNIDCTDSLFCEDCWNEEVEE